MSKADPQAWIYSVRCTFPTTQIRDQWLIWLMDGHAQALLDAGALSATLIQLETPALCVEVRYRFADRMAFERYERDHAPALREQGIRRWPAEMGLKYQRTEGAVIGYLDAKTQLDASQNVAITESPT
ncbi:MAG: hypothetical protein CMH53_09230 [Myxococcales bacterium]|nr:hypothetical protein [Myxococcales bacterium]|tara:strand:- start:110 stop:493 length:384 start_codon:yes stop_codon:yes gene_type:complete